MKNRLIYKFIAVFIAAAVISFFAISIIGPRLTYSHILHRDARSLYSEASNIAGVYGNSYYSGNLTTDSFSSQMSSLSTYLDAGIMLISTDGRIIMNTASVDAMEIPDFDATDMGSRHYRTDTFYDTYSERQLTVLYPVEYKFDIRGYIVISKPLSFIKKEANDIFNYNYLTFFITLAFCCAFVVVFIRNVSMPVARITKAADKYAKGDFSEKIKLGRNDELGRLSDSLDYMASEIENLNEYQRKFIANISHDFRSPLTSIKGYLEAMLDGTIPPEAQEKYLGIVIAETERLTKLTNNLLTLNNMNENGMVLDISDFDIVAIIKQTIQTFEGQCARRKIKFKLVFSDKVLMVSADQGKIQQVLYNLIDNAIKFSSNDSSIIISAAEKNDKVMISVKDFGIGIPKESISKIWDRFYKTDLSRGKDKKGTGLGLSIVKDIITAHKEYIDVISTEGVGTEFIFGLPKSKPGRSSFGLGLND